MGDRSEPSLDLELKLIRAVTTHLPRVTGAGIAGNWARDFYARRTRPRVTVPVLGAAMELDPGENVDGTLLFCPQLYDRRELGVLLPRLAAGDVFIDVGAHIGFYALQAARRVGSSGRVIAIEADPGTHALLAANTARNPGLPVTAVCMAASDESGTAQMAINTSGNRSGSSLLVGGDELIEVSCRPLAAILDEQGVDRVDAMKLDVEGMEYRVLRRYLADVGEQRRPRTIVLEHQPRWIEAAGGDAEALLLAAGYRVILATSLNRVLVRA